MLSFVSFQLLADRWTLDLVTLSFLIMKTLEYSLRGVLMEMVCLLLVKFCGISYWFRMGGASLTT